MRHLLLLSVLLLLLPQSHASVGDNLPQFQKCVTDCTAKCPDSFTAQSMFQPPTFLQRLLLWDCASNCDYQCQQIITSALVQNGEPIEQFHGKWPFLRLLNTQELLSVIFSMLNFIPHYKNSFILWNKYSRAKGTSEGGIKVLYWNIYIVSIVTSFAWLFSTLFHIRDLNITEKLDYYFAGLTVLSGFHYMIIRVFHLHNDKKMRHRVTILCLFLFIYHIGRLTYEWSYTYNMQANIFIALIQYSLFLVLAYRHYKEGNVKLAIMPIVLIGSVLFGMCFEVFDFFWIGLQLDAHAFWHAVTVWPGFYLYDFFYQDVATLKGYVD